MIPPARTTADRARVHIKALVDETKHQAASGPPHVQAFLSGMLSGLAASVEILDGGTAEKSMELMAQRLAAAIGQAYLDGKLPPTSLAAPDADQQLSRYEEIRGVQAQLALDLHQALGWSLNGGGQHQGRKSWADWWAELCAEVRILKRVDSHRDERHRRVVDEDGPEAVQREIRRANIRQQLAQASRDGVLNASAAELLRCQVEAEMSEADTARAVAAGNLRHVKTLVPELEQAQAAIDRVRHLCEMTISSSVRVHAIDQARDTLAALDRQPISPAAAITAAGTPVMTSEPDSSPLRGQIAAALYERERPPRDPAWSDAYAADREVFESMADAVLAVILPTTRLLGELHRSAHEDLTRVIDLYERWVKGGPPPLGISISRWWDKRLLELRHAVVAEPGETPS